MSTSEKENFENLILPGLSGGEKLLYRRAEENKIFNDFDSLQEKMRNEK
jgi:hypothetical protein